MSLTIFLSTCPFDKHTKWRADQADLDVLLKVPERHTSRICQICRKLQVGLSKQDKRSEGYLLWKAWATWTFLMLADSLSSQKAK